MKQPHKFQNKELRGVFDHWLTYCDYTFWGKILFWDTHQERYFDVSFKWNL